MANISIDEFHERGYLQEVNRQFLHPLGLALQISVDSETGKKRLYAINDNRHVKGGMVFEPQLLSSAKTQAVEDEMNEKAQERLDLYGYIIQPVGE
jgi:hypothetical protein